MRSSRDHAAEVRCMAAAWRGSAASQSSYSMDSAAERPRSRRTVQLAAVVRRVFAGESGDGELMV
jgi:hypothetical protein